MLDTPEGGESLEPTEGGSDAAPKGRRGNPLWKKGESGNPSGRPKGSKNRLTLLREAVLADAEEIVLENWEKIVRVTVQLAEAGDTTALKILWDRMIPSRKAVDNDNADRKDFGIKIIVQGMDVRPTAVAGDSRLTIDGEIVNEE